jgi:hypothetical protein
VAHHIFDDVPRRHRRIACIYFLALVNQSGERSEGHASILRPVLTSDSGGFECHCQEAGGILALTLL